jgi:hypothetical protein
MRPVRAVLRKVLRIRSMTALALIFWCAGAGCMLVSYARASMTDAVDSSQSAVQMLAGASSAMDAHACCKAKHRSASGNQTQPASSASSAYAEQILLSIPTAPTQSGAMSCCPLTSGSMVVASRSQSNDRAIVSEATSSSSLLVISSDPPPLSVPLRLPDRAHSYLLDCAFLI